MSELKPGWKKVKFGEVVRLNRDTSRDPLADGLDRYIGLEHLTPGDLQIRSWGDVADGITFTSRFRPGHVLFGKRRAYQRKIAVADFEGVCSGDIYVFESKDPNVLLPELLPFICQTDAFFDHAIGTSAGSLSPRTNWTSLAKYEFALPPLAEQRSAVNVLGAAWNAVNAYLNTLSNARELYDSALLHLYQVGTQTNAKSDPATGLPVHWKFLPLGERYEIQLGKMMSKAAREGPNQVPYIRNANVQWNSLELDDVQTMSFSPKEQAKFELRFGDILVCEGGHVGKSALWREEIPGACYQKALHRLRRLTNRDEPEFLLHCLRYYSITNRFFAATGETTIPHLPAARFRAMLFPFPPLEEQREIVAAVREIDSGVSAATQRLNEHRTTINVLIQQVFEGAR